MKQHPPIFTLTVPPFPYTTLFRSARSRGSRFTARPLQSADDERMVRPTRRLDRRASARGGTGDLRDRVLRRGDRGRRDRAGAAAAVRDRRADRAGRTRSEAHTSELQSLMRISYAVFCLKKKN